MSEEVMYSRINSIIFNGCSTVDTSSETSTLMSELLSLDNITAEELTLCRQSTFFFECIYSDFVDVFATGSFIDCSYTQKSDLDLMVQMTDIEATDLDNCEDNKAANVMVINTNGCAPGYTLLNVYNRVSHDLKQKYSKALLESCVKNGDHVFLSNKFHFECVIGKMMSLPITASLTRHGPCVMLKSENGGQGDYSNGIKCSSWPKEAVEWVTRRRESNWPDAALIDKIKIMPCHVVPVGNPNSDKCSLEWRFAFILQERELIWSFNDVQIQCYFIFKTLMKDILDEIAPGEINSFHLKTILFWLSEKSINWNKITLFENVRRCLTFLDECIKGRHLSHYFLTERNLFAEKLTDEKVRTLLSSKISRIQENILECFLRCKYSYYYDNSRLKILRLCLKDEDSITAEKIISLMALNLLQARTDALIFLPNTHTRARNRSMTLSSVIFTPKRHKFSLYNIIKHVSNQPQCAILGEYAVMFLSIRLGILCLVEAKATVDIEKRQNLISEAKCCFENGLNHDALAGRMYLQTYFYFIGSYDDIGTFVKDLLSKRMAILYRGTLGSSISTKCISPDMDKTVHHKEVTNENISVAVDVVFFRNDFSCVPSAIQYECVLINCRSNNNLFCSINPLVYACYLKFQVAFKQNNSEQLRLAVEHLRKMVLYVDKGHGKCGILHYRHYNILGYCYYVMNDESNAILWFAKSLKACHSTGNAAALYLCFLLFNSRTNIS